MQIRIITSVERMWGVLCEGRFYDIFKFFVHHFSPFLPHRNSSLQIGQNWTLGPVMIQGRPWHLLINTWNMKIWCQDHLLTLALLVVTQPPRWLAITSGCPLTVSSASLISILGKGLRVTEVWSPLVINVKFVKGRLFSSSDCLDKNFPRSPWQHLRPHSL